MKALVSATPLILALADASLLNLERMCDGAVTNREERLQKMLLCEKKVLGTWLVAADKLRQHICILWSSVVLGARGFLGTNKGVQESSRRKRKK